MLLPVTRLLQGVSYDQALWTSHFGYHMRLTHTCESDSHTHVTPTHIPTGLHLCVLRRSWPLLRLTRVHVWY